MTSVHKSMRSGALATSHHSHTFCSRNIFSILLSARNQYYILSARRQNSSLSPSLVVKPRLPTVRRVQANICRHHQGSARAALTFIRFLHAHCNSHTFLLTQSPGTRAQRIRREQALESRRDGVLPVHCRDQGTRSSQGKVIRIGIYSSASTHSIKKVYWLNERAILADEHVHGRWPKPPATWEKRNRGRG